MVPFITLFTIIAYNFHSNVNRVQIVLKQMEFDWKRNELRFISVQFVCEWWILHQILMVFRRNCCAWMNFEFWINTASKCVHSIYCTSRGCGLCRINQKKKKWIQRLKEVLWREFPWLTLYRRVPNAWLLIDHYCLVRLDIVMQAQRHELLPSASLHSVEQLKFPR